MPSFLHEQLTSGVHAKRKVIGVTVGLVLTIIGMVIGMSFIKIDESEGQKTRNQTNLIGFFVMFGILLVMLVLVMFIQPVGLWQELKLKTG